jgi:ABC-type nitrate/sulfonate/bicarbonate transport system substrate-binding protein
MAAGRYLLVAVAAAGVLVLGACGSGGGGGGGGGGQRSGGSAPTTSITVGTSGATGAYGPLYVGVQQGVFAKYGVHVTLQTLTPNSATAAVLSGNIDIAFDGPNLVAGILSNPAAHIDASAGPTVFYIYARKGISSIQDLKGKTIAVTTPGGSLDTAVKAEITKSGLRPGTDVKIAYLQTNSAALAAAHAGSVQAAGVSPPTSVQAKQAGLVELANITRYSPPGLMAVNNAFAKNHADALMKFMKAFKAANTLAVANNADSDKALRQYVKITDQAQLDGTWQAYKQAWTVAPYPHPAMQVILHGLATANPPVKGAASAKLADIIDDSFVDKVS